MHALNNVKIGAKLIGGFLIVAILLVGIAVLGFVNMKTIDDGMTTMYTHQLVPISQLGQADSAFYELRGDFLRFILLPDERATIAPQLDAGLAGVDEGMKKYRASFLVKEEKDELARFDLAWQAYQKVFADVRAKAKAGNDTEAVAAVRTGGALLNARFAVTDSLDKLIQVNLNIADATSKQGDATFANATRATGVSSVIAVILAVLIGIVLTRSTANPLVALTAIARRVAGGDLAASVPTDQRADEVGVLAQAFRQMLENLRRSTMDIAEGKRLEEELRGASLYARNLIEASLDPLVTISPEGKITDVNQTTEQATGVGRARLIGSDFADYFTEPEKARAGYQQVFSQGMVKDYPLTMRHVSGRTTDVLYNASVYKDAAGVVQGVFAAARDVTERKRMDDELRTYREQLETMVKQRTAELTSVLAEVKETVGILAASSSEILTATTQVAAGTAETATAINQTTTTVEEVRQAAQLSAQKAKHVSDSAHHVAQVAQGGQQAVIETASGMNHIRTQMESIAHTVVRLSEQSQSIGGIIASVTDIADQSNLLAVNAAIEAARAGEQGRGFAVVAQEIKSLAEQSKQATAQVRSILNDVQKATSAAVMATEQGSKAVEVGVKQAAQAGEAIRVLAETAGEAVQAATQIVASSQQQVVGMDQIGTAMESINQAGAETAASMRQAETAAQDLHELGQKFKELVGQFKA